MILPVKRCITVNSTVCLIRYPVISCPYHALMHIKMPYSMSKTLDNCTIIIICRNIDFLEKVPVYVLQKKSNDLNKVRPYFDDQMMYQLSLTYRLS